MLIETGDAQRRMRLVTTGVAVGLAALGLWLFFHALAPVVSAGAPPVQAEAVVAPLDLTWSSLETKDNYSTAWGDVDGDGDLDLAVGSLGEVGLYRNDGAGNLALAWTAPITAAAGYGYALSVAWGDVNGDGYLDLAVGVTGNYNYICQCHTGGPNRLFLNTAGVLDSAPAWSSAESDVTYAVAWGDYNNDGQLDLAVGNYGQPNRIYKGIGGTLALAWTAAITSNTTSLAWADVNRDGYLDLAVGNYGQANNVYLNSSGVLPSSPAWAAAGAYNTQSLAWGDYDNDGDPDLAVGNNGAGRQVYRNDAGALATTPVWTSIENSQRTATVAWGDYDNDGYLDLMAINGSDRKGVSFSTLDPNQLYHNSQGVLSANATWASDETDASSDGAWADVNGDGALDLAVVNWKQPIRLYLNRGGNQPLSLYWSAPSNDYVTSAVWGDYDNDGNLDLVTASQGKYDVCNCYLGGRIRLYHNSGGPRPGMDLVWTSAVSEATAALAWGDFDKDGYLDLAVANGGIGSGIPSQANRIYHNTGGVSPTLTLSYTSAEIEQSTSLAWGDYDNDGRLDLAVGTYNAAQQSRIYHNDGNGLFTSVWQVSGANSNSVTWVDYDGDGDLDLFMANDGYPSKLYRNDGGVLSTTPVWSTPLIENTQAAAWGDYDGDGDPDLALANDFQPLRLYRNDGGAFSLAWSPSESGQVHDLAWVDYDNDGDLDLSAANRYGQPLRLYRNDGGLLTPKAAWSSTELQYAQSVSWGDMDGDGDQDLALSNEMPGPVRIYANNRDTRFDAISTPLVRLVRPTPPGTAELYSSGRIWSGSSIPISFNLFDPFGQGVREVRAYYSVNGGGQWLPAVAAGGQVTTNLGTTAYSSKSASKVATVPIPDLGSISSTLTLTPSLAIADMNVWVNISHTWDSDLVITLTAPFSRSVTLVKNRGGSGDAFTNTIFDDEALTAIAGGVAPFTGSYRSEQRLAVFDGQILNGAWTLKISDVAAPDVGILYSWGLTATLNNGASYVFNWDPAASGLYGQSDNVAVRLEAAPFAASVHNGVPGPYLYGNFSAQTDAFRARGSQVRVISDGLPISGAVVYRLPAGLTTGGAPILPGNLFTTDAEGYLQGRSQINLGDQLVALLPVQTINNYTIYHTSGQPDATGLTAHTVTATGVQTLTITSTHPLILFDLDVSLEWDASKDAAYLEQLNFNLRRASQYLYDFTDGQVALGKITIFQNADSWAFAHIAIQATNRLRPSAVMGGVVPALIEDSQNPGIFYAPGQVHIGSTWNRYGAPGQNLGDDWSIILAHELSHYLFGLDDTYLGLDNAGHLIPVAACKGSAMGDVYNDPTATEFIVDPVYWQANCSQTLSARTLHRTEWDTLKLWYPPLVTPVITNPGPGLQPYNFTNLVVNAPLTPTDTLDDPSFYLIYQSGATSSSEARAYLIKNDQYIVDLGSPFGGQNRLIARGAAPGDRLCVFDRPAGEFGCEIVARGDDELNLKQDATWTPVLLMRPVNSTTLNIQVSGLPTGLNLRSRLFPEFGVATGEIGLVESGGIYSGAIVLADPTQNGSVQIWANETFRPTETNPRREAIVAFSVGGNPGTTASGLQRAGGGLQRAGGGLQRAGGGLQRAGGAPVVSPDGQMIFFAEATVPFDPGQFYTIQGMAGLPPLPAGRTVVGQGYALVASPGTPILTGSVSIQYLANDVQVVGAQESDLVIYYYTGVAWTELGTAVDAYFNLATAPSQGEGVYALMASIRVPLTHSGWNLIAYPAATAPVTQALMSIQGFYTTVYGYNADDLVNPWRVYDVSTPDWANDLKQLEYGKGYWINASQALTIHFKSGLASAAMPEVRPLTLWGMLPAGLWTAGSQVEVRVGSLVCGAGLVRSVPGGLGYVLDVSGMGACGQSALTVRVDGAPAASTAWVDGQVQRLDLSPGGYKLYLPLLQR